MMLRADIATGETTLDRLDLRLPGPLPLRLARSYRSNGTATIFGLGWRHGLDRTVRVEVERVVYRDGAGEEVVFAPVGVGMEARHPGGLVLQHHADAYVIYASPLVQEVFRKRPAPDGSLQLDRFEDASGNRIQLTYANGRLSEVLDSAGRRVRFVYAGGVVGQLVLVGADGNAQPIRAFRYGAGNTLVRETDAVGQTTEYAYEGGLLVRVSAASGARVLAQYDAQRRCIALWSGDGTDVRHLAYDPLRQTTRALGTEGRQTLYRHVSGRQVLEAIDDTGESVNYYYDEAQRLIGQSAPGGRIATFQRLDPEARTLFQIDHETRIAEAQCGEHGLVETVADAFGNTYALGYDDRYTLTHLTTPGGARWSFERDRKGRVTAIESPEGRRVQLQRTDSGLAVADATGTHLHITTDARGRAVTRTDRRGHTQRFRYDAEDRLTGVEVADAYSLSLDYDGAGRLVRAADSERRVMRWQRDPAGRILTVEAEGKGPVRLTYDLAGRVASASGAGGTVRFGYDAQGRLVGAEGPGEPLHFDYAEGRVTTRRAGSERVYNVLGDLLEMRRLDGSRHRFGYGPSGELMSAEREDGEGERTTVFDYDAEGRLTRCSEVETDLVFGYDRDGLLTEVEADSGVRVVLTYDARCRPNTIQVGEASFQVAFDDGDQFVGLRGPDGALAAFRYDGGGQLAAWRLGDGVEQPMRAGMVEQPVLEATPLALVAARHGLGLVARLGVVQVPLWGREATPCGVVPLTRRIVAGLAFGPPAALSPASAAPDVAGWTAWAEALRGFGDEIPRAAALAMPWPTLDFFALARSYHDPQYEARTPGALPYHHRNDGQDADDALTGVHRTTRLRPCVGLSQALGPQSDAEELPPVAHPVGADFALRLYHTLTRPGSAPSTS